ncbi:MAG: molecular chaperone GrpE (heat shock protein), partial [Kiritimatiellia bacterium]
MTRDEQSTDEEGTTEQVDPAAEQAPVEQAPAEAEPVVNFAEEQAAKLRVQLDEQSARLRTVSKAYKDLQHEMDAFRRRQQAMADAKAERKAARVVERFFEPVQNLKRSLEAGGDAESLREGVSLVL